MRNSHLLYHHIASQRNAAVMKKVNVGSTKVFISTFIYKEIMFNTAQHNITQISTAQLNTTQLKSTQLSLTEPSKLNTGQQSPIQHNIV